MPQTTNYILFKKNYLKNFIIKIFQKEEKIHTLHANFFYSSLKFLIKKPPKTYIPLSQKNILSGHFRFELPNWNGIDTNYNFYLSSIASLIIQKNISQLFDYYFQSFFLETTKQTTIENTVFLFIEKYNLGYDCYEMLKKRIYRFNKKNKDSIKKVPLLINTSCHT